MILDAWGWCTEMTQRDGMGREEGEGFRMGNTCIPVVDSCWCMAKPIQYCKVINLQLKYINLYIKKRKKYLVQQIIITNHRFKYFFFFFYFILLYNTVLVLPYINMNPPWVYMSSQSWTPLPPPSSPYHLSGSSQCTSPKHPVSCIKPRLEIHFLYDIIHVSMPFSQIILPSPHYWFLKGLKYRTWARIWTAE